MRCYNNLIGFFIDIVIDGVTGSSYFLFCCSSHIFIILVINVNLIDDILL